MVIPKERVNTLMKVSLMGIKVYLWLTAQAEGIVPVVRQYWLTGNIADACGISVDEVSGILKELQNHQLIVVGYGEVVLCTLYDSLHLLIDRRNYHYQIKKQIQKLKKGDSQFPEYNAYVGELEEHFASIL